MSKIRVYQLANELNIPSKKLVELLTKNGIPVKNHMSVLGDAELKQLKDLTKKSTDRKNKNDKKETKPNPNNRNNRQSKGNNQRRNIQERKDKQQGRSNRNQNKNDKSKRRQNDRSFSNNNQQQKRNKNNQDKGNRNNPQAANRSNRRKNSRNNNLNLSNNNQRQRGNQPKKKKTYKNKKAERPIKLRDNSKRNKNKHVDYRKQREERKADQRKNKVYEIPELLTVGELADILELTATDIIKDLMLNGTMATINQQIDAETAQIVADDLGYKVQQITTEDVFEKIFDEYDNTVTGNEKKRPPVVTVMGHVDHGKTSLLDKIRETNVASGEAGGITQHIGAYTVEINGEQITFIDTPGHAAFTAMRSRGAQLTDIAVLVVAADDGVMPQTIEAINHAKAAEVPIIIAINKIDKEGSNPERVKQELTEQNIVVEEWGGQYIAVPISAKKGTNIDELLENILLIAEMEELKADENREARGHVIEAEVKKGKGATASLLIQQGTLNIGDVVLSGTTYGRVRTMIDDQGNRIKSAGPSQPVEVSGLSDIPEAGDDFIVLTDEKEARQLAQQRSETEKLQQQKKNTVNLNDIFNRIQEGEISDVNIIVKADVQGSVEAISSSLENLNTEEVRVNVIHGAVGAVNETDVMLASTSNAIIIAFNVRADRIARTTAEKEEIDIRYYSVIYDAIDDVKNAMEGLLEPEFVENIVGEAEVREVFRIPGGVMIAGSYVTDGKVNRADQARLIRDGVVIYQGNIGSLRRFKDDVKEVVQGFECGIGIENMNDIKVGDVIETYNMEAVKRTL